MQNGLARLALNCKFVALRTMELQMTDFENAAFSVFVVLLTRAIVSFNLNMYIPISKVCKCESIYNYTITSKSGITMASFFLIFALVVQECSSPTVHIFRRLLLAVHDS